MFSKLIDKILPGAPSQKFTAATFDKWIAPEHKDTLETVATGLALGGAIPGINGLGSYWGGMPGGVGGNAILGGLAGGLNTGVEGMAKGALGGAALGYLGKGLGQNWTTQGGTPKAGTTAGAPASSGGMNLDTALTNARTAGSGSWGSATAGAAAPAAAAGGGGNFLQNLVGGLKSGVTNMATGGILGSITNALGLGGSAQQGVQGGLGGILGGGGQQAGVNNGLMQALPLLLMSGLFNQSDGQAPLSTGTGKDLSGYYGDIEKKLQSAQDVNMTPFEKRQQEELRQSMGQRGMLTSGIYQNELQKLMAEQANQRNAATAGNALNVGSQAQQQSQFDASQLADANRFTLQQRDAQSALNQQGRADLIGAILPMLFPQPGGTTVNVGGQGGGVAQQSGAGGGGGFDLNTVQDLIKSVWNPTAPTTDAAGNTYGDVLNPNIGLEGWQPGSTLDYNSPNTTYQAAPAQGQGDFWSNLNNAVNYSTGAGMQQANPGFDFRSGGTGITQQSPFQGTMGALSTQRQAQAPPQQQPAAPASLGYNLNTGEIGRGLAGGISLNDMLIGYQKARDANDTESARQFEGVFDEMSRRGDIQTPQEKAIADAYRTWNAQDTAGYADAQTRIRQYGKAQAQPTALRTSAQYKQPARQGSIMQQFSY
jgi:hypothetical protein